MAEAERLVASDLWQLLEFLRGRSSNRKLRFFAVACYRRIWSLMAQDSAKQSVLTVERYGDGQATFDELTSASELVSEMS